MVQFRDIYLRRQNREARKQDKLIFKRAVLTDEGGNQTSSNPLDDVWASSSERRVWFMVDGAVQPAQILCRKVSDPYVGLGVIIGKAEGSNQLEVLTDDFFLTATGDPTAWASTAPRDFEPGGRKMMWVYTKVIVPLATYPGSGVSVNVVSGDYPYGGARKTYNGSVNFSLSGNVPGAGLCRYVGLYLDSSNVLQAVNGATTTAGLTPAEPTWPAGAFRLCVVLLTNGDTSIDFADIYDRRMAWSDEQAGTSGWPFAKVWTVSATDTDADFSTIASAIASASVLTDDIIWIDAGTYTETLTLNKRVTLRGAGIDRTIITSADAVTLTITAASATVEEMTVKNTHAAAVTASCIKWGVNGVIFNRVSTSKTSGASTIGAGFYNSGGSGAYLNFCLTSITSGTSQYGILSDAAGTNVVGGVIRGDTQDIFSSDGSAFIWLFNPILTNQTISWAGTSKGRYFDANGNTYILNTTGRTSGAWLIDESVTLKIKYADLAAAITAAASSGDTVKLDTDTYSISARQDISKSLTISGDGPEATIITNSVSNDACFDVTADNTAVIFKDLTFRHTGGGTNATGIFTNNTGVTITLDNAVLEISSGAGTTSIGAWIEAGTLILRNGAKIVVTSGTSKYGVYNDAGAATITLGAGCTVNGATADVYGDQAGSTLNLQGCILTNAIANFAGTVQGQALDQYGRKLRRKPAGINGGRLTLTSGTPVTTANVTAATTVYDTPGPLGGETEVYNGYFWVEIPYAEISVAVPSTIYRAFDIFEYDNAGALALETVNWNQTSAAITNATNATPIVVSSGTLPSVGDIVFITGVGGNTAANGLWVVSATGVGTFTLQGSVGNGAYTAGGTWYKLNGLTRATALTAQDGRYVKNGDATRTYKGTGMTTATSGQCEDSATKRFLWNYYNRAPKGLSQTYVASHTYNLATVRPFNNLFSGSCVLYVVGVAELGVQTIGHGNVTVAAGNSNAAVGVGFNVNNASSVISFLLGIVGSLGGDTATDMFYPVAGFNYIVGVEQSGATGTAPTFSYVVTNGQVEC